MGGYNPEIVKDTLFIREYMTENVIYHTDVCSFMWSDNKICFMKYDIAAMCDSSGKGSLGYLVMFYLIDNGVVISKERRFISTLDQSAEFNSFLSLNQ